MNICDFVMNIYILDDTDYILPYPAKCLKKGINGGYFTNGFFN